MVKHFLKERGLINKIEAIYSDYVLSSEQINNIKEIEEKDRKYVKEGTIWSLHKETKSRCYDPFVYSRLTGRSCFPQITKEEIEGDVKAEKPKELIKTKLRLTAERLISEIKEGFDMYNYYDKMVRISGNWEYSEGRNSLYESIIGRTKILEIVYDKLIQM